MEKVNIMEQYQDALTEAEDWFITSQTALELEYHRELASSASLFEEIRKDKEGVELVSINSQERAVNKTLEEWFNDNNELLKLNYDRQRKYIAKFYDGLVSNLARLNNNSSELDYNLIRR